MRQIKLRAWAKEAKVMHPVWTKTDDENGAYEIMQWTGLVDKNNVPIWEWDIVKTNNGTYEIIFVADWSTLTPGFYVSNKEGKNWMSAHQFMEVIGNIFETPELLNNTENN